jgi:nicotinamidase-related amidase
MATLWTEICLAFPVIHALGDGDDIYFVSEASGGVTREAHEMAIQRMIQADAVPLTWGVLSAEWQRDWAHEGTLPGLAQIFVEHYGATGTSFLWEQQLLSQGGSRRG